MLKTKYSSHTPFHHFAWSLRISQTPAAYWRACHASSTPKSCSEYRRVYDFGRDIRKIHPFIYNGNTDKRLIILLYSTRSVFGNRRASSLRKWQACIFLLFPSPLQGTRKVPPRFLNPDLMTRFGVIGLWSAAGWFQTGTAKQNTEQVTALLRVLFKVTTLRDTTQESESVSLNKNQRRSSQGCSWVSGNCNLYTDGVKEGKWLLAFKQQHYS